MSDARFMTAAEAAVLDALLPEALTSDMREVAHCLYAAQVLQDGRCGQRELDASWLAALQAMAELALAQLQHLVAEIGGRAVYLAKGVAVHLSARDRELCAAFNGRNYQELARRYDLTEMRVRQIVSAWRAEQFAQRQGRLDV